MTKPLPLTDPDDLQNLQQNEPERLVVINGQTYDVDDLFTCSCCGEHALEDEQDNENRCEACVQEAHDEDDHQRYLWSWYNSTRL